MKRAWVPFIDQGPDFTTHFAVYAFDPGVRDDTGRSCRLRLTFTATRFQRFGEAVSGFPVIGRREVSLRPNERFTWAEVVDAEMLEEASDLGPFYVEIEALEGEFFGHFWLSWEGHPDGPVTWGFRLPTPEDTLPGTYQGRFEYFSGIVSKSWVLVFLPEKNLNTGINRPIQAWSPVGDAIRLRIPAAPPAGIELAHRAHLFSMSFLDPEAPAGKIQIDAEGSRMAAWTLMVANANQRCVGERWERTIPRMMALVQGASV